MSSDSDIDDIREKLIDAYFGSPGSIIGSPAMSEQNIDTPESFCKALIEQGKGIEREKTLALLSGPFKRTSALDTYTLSWAISKIKNEMHYGV